ncbi:MAG TPA: hypothetical protein VK151_09310 [Fluviicola sp.]|nr:hypothetical protein [Fluviicola sp.]
MKTQIEEIIKRINSLHHEDPEIPTELDKITHLLSQNLDNTIEVLNTLDEHSINWVCSSFPEISAALESKRFIASIKQLQDKFPNLDLEIWINEASKYA